MFYGCINLEQAPEIPENLVNMAHTFYGCKKLTGNVVIHGESNDVISASGCFF